MKLQEYLTNDYRRPTVLEHALDFLLQKRNFLDELNVSALCSLLPIFKVSYASRTARS